MDIASAYRFTFSTPAGKDVLEDLRAQFYDVDLKRTDAHSIALAAGAHGAVRYILDMMEKASNERER